MRPWNTTPTAGSRIVRGGLAALAVAILLGIGAGVRRPPASATAANREVTVAVTTPGRECREAPVSVSLPASREYVGITVRREGKPVPSQTRRDGDQLAVTWIARELRQGRATEYRLALETRASAAVASGVTVDRNGENLDLRVNGELFTRYDTTTGPNKPYFYPLNGPGGRRLTRHYPIETVAGETRDHPHHRGLWFTHGAVNGGDYWAEGPNAPKSVHRKYEGIESGPVYGAFRALTDWIGRDGKKVCEDSRDVRLYNTASGQLLDLTITLRATEGPLTLGDTKEGTFGLRLADTMRVKGGGGHIETSTGLKDAGAWGKRAAWVDYYGPVDGSVVGVAIFDHPTSFRHPTWWHVRDYGLFAANPFGIHDFEPDRPAGAGDHTLPAEGALTFRYRLYVHSGTTTEARVADLWPAYAEPPRAEVR